MIKEHIDEERKVERESEKVRERKREERRGREGKSTFHILLSIKNRASSKDFEVKIIQARQTRANF